MRQRTLTESPTLAHGVITAFLLMTFVTTSMYGAANVTWTGNAGSPGNWNDGLNWSSGVPASGDNLFFHATSQTTTTNNIAVDFDVRKIDFNSSSPSYTFEGQRIALQGTGIQNASSNPHIFNLDISLSGLTTVKHNSDLTFNGVFSGGGGLNLSGSQQSTITQLNTFTGDFNVISGTVNVNTIRNNSVPSAVGQGTRIVLGNGATTGTINYTGAGDTWSRNMKIGGNTGGAGDTGGGRFNSNGLGALVITNAQSFTPNGGVIVQRLLTFGGANTDNNEMQMAIIDNNTGGGGTVGVVKADSGKWILSGANTYTGPTTVTGGTLVVTSNITTSSDVSVTAGATLTGTGSLPAIGGGGSVDPGDSPGIMTTPQVDPSGGMDFNFEMTGESIVWAPINNDVLHITDGTPFTSALGAGNEINLYLSSALVAGLEKDDVVEGGFYTDAGDPLADISGAILNVFAEDGGGAISYNGIQYSPMLYGSSFVLGTAADTQFDAGGYISTFTYAIPEPASLTILALCGLGLLRRARRQETC